MPLKYNPVRDEEPPPSSSAWAWVCLIFILPSIYLLYKIQQPPPPEPPKVVEAAPHRLAPEGTFFVVNYISIKTKTGIIGFEPGQEVQFVTANPAKGTLLVSDGKYQTELDPSQLTNDLDIAELARKQDQESQRSLAQFQDAQRQAYDYVMKQVNLDHSKHVSELNSALIQKSVVGIGTSLNDPTQAASRGRRVMQGSPVWYLSPNAGYSQAPVSAP